MLFLEALILIALVILGIVLWAYICVSFNSVITLGIRRLRRPLVFICSRNGFTAIVRAKDFRRDQKRFWFRVAIGEMKSDTSGSMIYTLPVFVFSKMPDNPYWKGSVGSMEDLQRLLADCDVERRTFYVPDVRTEVLGPFTFGGTREFIHRRLG